MDKYIKRAAKAWTGATLNIQRFADAYVEATGMYGQPAADRFMEAYPMFGEREWTRLGLVGNGILLPQFLFKSDFFVNKLLKLKGSMRFQKALVAASDSGRLRSDRGKGEEKVKLSDLTSREEKALAMLLSEDGVSPADIRMRCRTLVAKINKSNESQLPTWEIKNLGGNRVVRVNRACNLDEDSIRLMMSGLREGSGRSYWRRPPSEILRDLVDAIVELEGMRDAEWDFEDSHGARDMWDDDVSDEHKCLLDTIQKCRERVQNLSREATGNPKMSV